MFLDSFDILVPSALVMGGNEIVRPVESVNTAYSGWRSSRLRYWWMPV